MFLKPQVCVEYGNQTREHQSGHQSSYWLWTSVLIIIIIQPTVKVTCPAGYVTLSSRVPGSLSYLIKDYYFYLQSTYIRSIMSFRL